MQDVKQRMELKESSDRGVFIKDLTMIVVKNVSEMERYMMQGNKNRAVGET
jgi:kinesin family protein 3/17